MTESRKGFWAIFLSASIWGLSGIYYKAFDHVPALEVIPHLTLWSAVFFGLVIIVQRRLKDVLRNFLNPHMVGILLVSAAMISVNWSGFVFAIQKGWALDASFGYYIFPLMAVVLGMVLFGEKLSKLQGIAVIMGGARPRRLGVSGGAFGGPDRVDLSGMGPQSIKWRLRAVLEHIAAIDGGRADDGDPTDPVFLWGATP